jgi:hypothetical protein
VSGGGIDPTVRHVPLTSDDVATASRLGARDLDDAWAVSPEVSATGYATVGVTWAQRSAAENSSLYLRTRTGGAWSGWLPLRVSDEHGPGTASAEGQHVLQGTDPLSVGNVDAVQAKATSTGHSRPTDLMLSVIDPGEPASLGRTAGRLGGPDYPARTEARTPRPGIFSRAQWGADESMRNGFAGYGEISAAFVHHTVNSNDYSRDEVPAILRGIYAYHTQSQGWSDVGYNFLVDRFGRIWEGRFGGIWHPVIGAHTLGYNENSFAMAAIGNFESVVPTRRMVRSYRDLFAWKLDRSRVAGNAYTRIDGVRLKTIGGHRDAGATACPGRHLYARIPAIRAQVAAAQTD